jgi:thiopurine S-methyltransferase
LTPDFWIERWQRGEIGFHQAAGNELLPAYWSKLGIAAGDTVFVPLCGKSVDMAWLAGQGHKVIGVELSALAVEEFFREQGVEAVVSQAGAFAVHTAGPISIWCGDIFELPASALSDVTAVYDRAALVALPPDLQPRYAEKIQRVVPRAAKTLLISLVYPDGQINGPPFSTPREKVAELFGNHSEITVCEARERLDQSPNLKKLGVTSLEEAVYILTPKAG